MSVVALSRDNSQYQDTYVEQGTTLTQGGASSLNFGTRNIANKVTRALLKFDLGLIPNDVIINSATLKLYQTGAPAVNDPFAVYAATGAWDNNTTWDTKPVYSSTYKADVLSPPSNNSSFTVDVKNIVEAWVNGTLPNNGFVLGANDEALLRDNTRSIGSFENATIANRPQLTIDYTIPSTGKKQVEYVGSGAVSKSMPGVNQPAKPTLPNGVQAGDLLVMFAGTNSSYTVPSGWTEVAKVTSPNNHVVFTKRATASEPSTVTFGSSTASSGAVIHAFRNVKDVAQIKQVTVVQYTNTFTPGNITGIAVDSAVLLLNVGYGQGNSTPPLNFQEISDEFAVWQHHGAFSYVHSKSSLTSSELTSTLAGQNGATFALVLTPIQNNLPTLTLSSPTNNQTLAEGNTMPVAGEASDADNGNVVTVKYKINNGTARAIASGVSDGSSPLSFAKSLTYSNKRLWDGSTDVTGADLAENVDHVLTVWAEDDQGGKSAEITRKFRVSHNKPPAITVDAFTPVQSGLIPPDLITISGTVSDPDGNTVTVTGKANNGAPQTLLSGVSGGNWSFSFPVSALQEGGNTITITATDQFGSSTVKTFNVNNAITKTPLDKGVARYKVTPPLGAAKEILAWMQREIGDLSVDGAASFVDAGQSEQYMTMAKSSVDLAHGIAEDEFVASVADPKADIVFKQTFTRTNTDSSESALKLVGVIE